jgi:hypothetical protein
MYYGFEAFCVREFVMRVLADSCIEAEFFCKPKEEIWKSLICALSAPDPEAMSRQYMPDKKALMEPLYKKIILAAPALTLAVSPPKP